jgi:hypothetical protein
MLFKEIHKFTSARYYVNVDWDGLENNLNRYTKNYNLQLEPEFQRAHVWTQEQQTKYVEWILKGGKSGRDIYFNYPNWMGSSKEPKDHDYMTLVDGLQRITAVRDFLNDKFSVFDSHFCSELQGENKHIPFDYDFIFHVNDIPYYKDVLQWYIDLNSGGTIHTDVEIERVKELLKNYENK